MPEMSGKFKSNPTKTNNLIYIMIFFQGRGGKKNSRGGKKISARFARHIQNIYPPLQNPYLHPCLALHLEHNSSLCLLTSLIRKLVQTCEKLLTNILENNIFMIFLYVYSTTMHELLQISSHNKVWRLSPPNQGRFFCSDEKYV